MQVVAGVLVVAGCLFTLGCAVWRRRSLFGVLLFLEVGFFIAGNFAWEGKNPLTLALTGAAFSALFLALGVRGLLRYLRREDAEVWFSAGMQGMTILWQRGRLTGAEARTFWLLQAVCSGILALGVAASVVGVLTQKPNAPPPDPDLGVRVRIVDPGCAGLPQKCGRRSARMPGVPGNPQMKKDPFLPFRIATTDGKTDDITAKDRPLLLVSKRCVLIGLRVPDPYPDIDRNEVVSLVHSIRLEPIALPTTQDA